MSRWYKPTLTHVDGCDGIHLTFGCDACIRRVAWIEADGATELHDDEDEGDS